MTPTTIYNFTSTGEAWKVSTGTRYEYGIFNADKEKICAANGVTPNDTEWAWLWNQPIAYEWDEKRASDRVDEINFERVEKGTLERFGPVMSRRRTVSYGEWEDIG